MNQDVALEADITDELVPYLEQENIHINSLQDVRKRNIIDYQ